MSPCDALATDQLPVGSFSYELAETCGNSVVDHLGGVHTLFSPASLSFVLYGLVYGEPRFTRSLRQHANMEIDIDKNTRQQTASGNA